MEIDPNYLHLIDAGVMAITSLYLARKIKIKHNIRKAMKKGGMEDSSGLVEKVVQFQSMPMIHGADERDGTSSELEHFVYTHLRIPRMTHDFISFMLAGKKPNFIRVYPYIQNGNEGLAYRLELVYDEGIQSGTFIPKNGTRAVLYQSIEFLRRQGYSVGLMN